MTAKELLRERVEALSEEEAQQALEMLDVEFFGFDEAEPGFPPAPPEIIETARRAIREADDGAVSYSTVEVLKSLDAD